MKNESNEQSAAMRLGAEIKPAAISNNKSRRLSSILFTFFKWFLVLLTFYYIYRYLISNWDQLSGLNIHVSYGFVILGFIVLKIGWVVSCWSWGKTLEACGYKLRFRDVYIIYFRSMLAKYLPGKVWQLAGSTYMALQVGVPEGANLASFIIGQAYSVLAGVVLVMAAIVFGIIERSGQTELLLRWTAIPIMTVIIILVIRPNLIEKLMNLILPLFKRQKITVKISFATSIFLIVIYIIPWLIFGLAFWLLAYALTSVSLSLYLPLTAIYTAGTVIGFMAVFAPGGIGIREASIAAMAGSLTSFPASLALALGLGYRLVTSIIELVSFGVTWLIPGSKLNKSIGNSTMPSKK